VAYNVLMLLLSYDLSQNVLASLNHIFSIDEREWKWVIDLIFILLLFEGCYYGK